MNNELWKKSILFGSFLGAIGGTLLGAAIGAITETLNGILIGAITGLILGVLTGILTAMLTVRFAGTTGGVSLGAYTGMAFGAVLGLIIAALIPESVRMSANTQQSPMLDALTATGFETAVLFSFLLAVLGTAVGAWVAGRNFIPREK